MCADGHSRVNSPTLSDVPPHAALMRIKCILKTMTDLNLRVYFSACDVTRHVLHTFISLKCRLKQNYGQYGKHGGKHCGCRVYLYYMIMYIRDVSHISRSCEEVRAEIRAVLKTRDITITGAARMTRLGTVTSVKGCKSRQW